MEMFLPFVLTVGGRYRGRGMVTLSSYLGERLHQGLKVYVYSRRTGCQKDPMDVLRRQLDAHFISFRKKLGIAADQSILLDNWTENEVRTWVVANVKKFIAFFKREQIDWCREEWSLDPTSLNKDDTRWTHLGTPDFVAYSKRRKAWLVIDFKNAGSVDMYMENGAIREPDKLLGYAFGARQHLKSEYGLGDIKPIVIGYMVFLRHKVTRATPAKMVLVEEKASNGRLSTWRKRYLRENPL